MFASSSNCFVTRSFDSYSATAASMTSDATATPTVRPTSARSRLGAMSCRMKVTVPPLEARDDLLAVWTLEPVDERLDRRLELQWIGVVDEVERPADRVRAVRERLAGGGDVLDGEQTNVRRGERVRGHGHHADGVLERA